MVKIKTYNKETVNYTCKFQIVQTEVLIGVNPIITMCYIRFSSTPWNSMDTPVTPWSLTESHGRPWNSMELHGHSMEFFGTPWNSTETPWSSMDMPWKLHGVPWNPMELHGTLWNSMEFHGTPWNSMGLFHTGQRQKKKGNSFNMKKPHLKAINR